MNNKLALMIIIVCLAVVYPLQKFIDQRRPPEELFQQMLYINNGNIVKKISFGFDGIMADFYWLRSVQYFGRQLLNESGEFDWARVSSVHYDLLYPLLDITTTLDPNYIEAYRFGSLFLPDYNYDLALRLLKKGIANNPNNWRLYQNLGTLYWHGKDYKNASDAFYQGGELPGAPYWMKILSGVMLTEGGSRKTACQLYTTLYKDAESNNDELIRSQMENQIKRIYAFDEQDYLNTLLDRYKQATDNCPESLKALGPTLRQPSDQIGACGQPIVVKINPQGEPICSLGEPFIYDAKKCKAKIPFEIDQP